MVDSQHYSNHDDPVPLVQQRHLVVWDRSCFYI